MSHIQEYKVIRAPNKDALELEVNKLLKKGWELCGNFMVDNIGWSYQPMIKLKADNCAVMD